MTVDGVVVLILLGAGAVAGYCVAALMLTSSRADREAETIYGEWLSRDELRRRMDKWN